MAENKVRVAVVGVGNVAQVAHLPAYKQHPDVEIAAIVEPDPVKGKKVAAQYGVKALYEDLTAMLRKEDVEAVDICTPNYLHAPMVITALRAQRHVLCEKPLARNAVEAKRMVETAKEANTVLMVAMNNRFREDVQVLQKFVHNGELGNIQIVKAGWRRSAQSWRQSGGWWTSQELAGGGALLDLGLPKMDLAMWVAGLKKPTRVACSVFGKHGKEGVEDSACAMVNFTGGACLILEVTWNLLEARDHSYLELYGSKGGANLTPLRIHKGMHGHLVNVTPALARGANDYKESYRREIDHFVECIRTGQRPRTTADEAWSVLRVLDAMYESAECGCEVSFT